MREQHNSRAAEQQIGGAPARGGGLLSAGLVWLGAGAILGLALLRAMVIFESLPHWETDATRYWSPMVGLGPAGMILLDVLTLAAAGAVMVGLAVPRDDGTTRPLARAGRGTETAGGGTGPAGPALLVLLCLGAAGVGLHAWFIGGGSLEDLRAGSSWLAALGGGLALYHAAGVPRLRRLVLAVAAAFVCMLALKGVGQVFLEHPLTREQFEQNREAFFQARGWSPDSPAARSFERRLAQPAAFGWFGMANVYGSFAAAGLVALLGWAVIAWRHSTGPGARLPNGWAGVITIGAILAGLALWMSRARGALGAAAFALAVMALIAAAPCLAKRLPALKRVPRHAGSIALAGIPAAMLAILLQGVLGDRALDLSLRFRAFYLQTATRVFLESPLVGVGPGSFKEAYTRLKPALSPEDVTSPHSILFDYGATLGVFGLAWAGLWLLWVYWAGRALAVPQRPDAGDPDGGPPPLSPDGAAMPGRAEVWFLIGTAALPTVVAAWIEVAATTPDGVLVRLLGLCVWIGVAFSLLAVSGATRAWVVPAGGAAVALAVHAQMDVTPVHPGSAALFIAMIAAAAGSAPGVRGGAGRVWAWAGGGVFAAMAGVMVVAGFKPAAAWEGRLTRAAERVRPVAEIRARLDDVSRAPFGVTEGGDFVAQIAEDLGRLAGVPTPTNDEQIRVALQVAVAVRSGGAAEHLRAAWELFPTHFPTARTASQMAATRGEVLLRLGREPEGREAVAEALRIARGAVEASPRSPAAWGWLGVVEELRFERLGETEGLSGAIQAWERAAELDPRGITFPYRLFRLAVRQEDYESARRWGRIALERNENLRLDPLAQLLPGQVFEVERVLNMP